MRRGELVKLKWGDVDLQASTVTIIQSKTDSKPATIKLPSFAVAELRAYRKTPAGLVVCLTDGTPIRPVKLSTAFRHLAETVGMGEFGIHDLRRAHATMLAASGLGARDIQDRLRHKSLQTTLSVYTWVTPESQDRAAVAIDALLAGSNGRQNGTRDSE